jgi:hypothetical protein
MLVAMLVAGIIDKKMQSQSETAEQKACKEKVMAEYWSVMAPMLRDFANRLGLDPKDIDKSLKEMLRHGDEREAVDLEYLKKWWSCHTRFLSAEDKKTIVDQGRWDEYVNLPVLLSDLLSRYVLSDATDILASYGHRETASAFRARHPK